MADEQIKQNAEEYAKDRCVRYNEQYGACYDAYIAGAHSRDEEIKHIKYLYDLAMDRLAEVEVQLGESQNQWISVDERLPEKVKGKYYSKFVLVRYNGFGCRYYVDRYSYPSKTWAFQVDGVTHWMPIPKLKKGE